MKNLTSPVNWGNGIIATPMLMLEKGQATPRKVEKFAASSKARPQCAYFIDIKGTKLGIKITKTEFDFISKNFKNSIA